MAGKHQDCTALLATLHDPLDAAGREITRARLPRTSPTAEWNRELLGMRTLANCSREDAPERPIKPMALIPAGPGGRPDGDQTRLGRG